MESSLEIFNMQIFFVGDGGGIHFQSTYISEMTQVYCSLACNSNRTEYKVHVVNSRLVR